MAKKTLWRFCLPLFALIHTALVLDCPSGWDGYGNSCYKFVQSRLWQGLNWENARTHCLGYGGDLVSITNESEMSFINGISSESWSRLYWIGLNDQRNESQFVWSDGTPYNASVYSNWHRWEPNDLGAGEDCVELYGKHWNDNSCKTQSGFICKRPKAPIACPSAWHFYGSSCYKFSSLKKNWTDAKKDCRASGGYLLKIDNAYEQHFITIQQSKGYKTSWIGLSDSTVEGSYMWESDNSLVNYTHWHTGKPDDYVRSEDCVEVYGGASAGYWNDNSCGSKNYFICEKPSGVPMPTFTTVTPPVTSASIACPFAWLNYGSSCYKFSFLKKNWINAKEDCQASGGYLLKIDNAAEQHFITYQHQQSKVDRRSWIGLSDSTVEGSFMWESDNSLVNYTHWDAGEPNDAAGSEDCVEVLGGASAGYWNDDVCGSKKYFICEKPGDRTTVKPDTIGLEVKAEDKEKRLKPWMIAVISVVAGILSLVLIIVVCLGKRREKKPLAIAQKYDQEEQVFEKDLFVSYSSKDYDWVQESLLPVLDENNIKYIIHSRDFVPGKAWLDNMADSVYNSRKVILIMSMNYLSSAFCKDEMRMAIHRCSERDDSSLIVVRIDDINSSAMPKILRHRTFIDVTSREETATWQRRILEYVQSMVSSGSVTEV